MLTTQCGTFIHFLFTLSGAHQPPVLHGEVLQQSIELADLARRSVPIDGGAELSQGAKPQNPCLGDPGELGDDRVIRYLETKLIDDRR